MKKVTKLFGAILLSVGVILSFNYVLAENAYYPNSTQTIGNLTRLTDRVWASAITVVQALAIGCVVFAGLRYMYASADRKADIKKGTLYLAIGAIFVFATTTVMRFIFNFGNELIK